METALIVVAVVLGVVSVAMIWAIVRITQATERLVKARLESAS